MDESNLEGIRVDRQSVRPSYQRAGVYCIRAETGYNNPLILRRRKLVCAGHIACIHGQQRLDMWREREFSALQCAFSCDSSLPGFPPPTLPILQRGTPSSVLVQTHAAATASIAMVYARRAYLTHPPLYLPRSSFMRPIAPSAGSRLGLSIPSSASPAPAPCHDCRSLRCPSPRTRVAAPRSKATYTTARTWRLSGSG